MYRLSVCPLETSLLSKCLQRMAGCLEIKLNGRMHWKIHRLYANITSFCIKDLNVHGFSYPWRGWFVSENQFSVV